MALVTCSLVACGFSLREPELQGLECSLVDLDPGTEAGPSMAHDLELSRDSLQLWPGGMFNFYCELFHISFIVSAGPGSMEYIAVSSAPEPVDDFTNLLHREITKRGQDCILHHPRAAVKLVARLLLALFYFSWPSRR